MKKMLLVSVLLSFFFSSDIYSQSVIGDIINQVNSDSLLYFVKELSGNVPTVIGGQPYTIQSRNKYQPGNDKAMQYIQEKLSSYGLTTSLQVFSSSGKNVIGIKTGTQFPNQKYMICAHFDDMPSGTLAPGADDNASGTAGVLEAARILKNYYSPYTIIFALWDEEEQGLIGSAYYANQTNPSDSLLAVFNMDMIAFDSNNDNVSEVHVKPIGITLNILSKAIELNTTYNIGLTLHTKNPGTSGSDHASFWYRNISAIGFTEDYTSNFNSYYHSVNDKIDYFNQPFFQKIAKLTIGTMAYYLNPQPTPVELTAFNAVYDNSVKLNWSTASELNNRGFIVEKKNSDYDWREIGFITGRGTSTITNNYFFEDKDVMEGKIYYRLRQVDFNGSEKLYSAIEVDVAAPAKFALLQNYPNPFNPSTSISYTIPQDGMVSLKVFDLLGNQVAELVNENQSAGKHFVDFDGKNLSSGVYIYQLQSGSFISAKRMVLIK